jgi:DNA-directed RNA polymerase omega subunit
MKLINIEDIDRVTSNRYEAVIVSAQHSRHLNAVRLARLARLGESENAGLDIESRKITIVALRDLTEGKVKFERSDTK